MSLCFLNGGSRRTKYDPVFCGVLRGAAVWFLWKRPEKCGTEGLHKCFTSMSVVQVKSKPASVALQAPPWNSLFRLFSCVATRNDHTNKEVHTFQEQSKALFGNLMDEEMSRQTATALPTGTSKCPPSQRVPTLSGTTASNSDLASLFECPVCFDYVLPPILQCQSGHLVCSNCRPKLTCCPTCRGPLGSIRNLAMEKVANSVLFPCKYASSGCEVTLPHTDKTEHEELCEFRPYSCPCPGASCKWQGSLDAVMPHLMHQHKSITTLQGEDIVFLATDINLPGAVDWVMMQSCFGFHFMLVLEKQEKYDGHQQFFAIVQLIGTRKQAENFAYRLELNGHRRRLTWEATPRSIHEGIATAIMNSDCLVFDTSIAQLFAENGNLGINVTISMC
ncbi:E3 ubiquitin-protein ligase Siah1 isoform X1 [Melanotaenia boesemani]|uniref:E3 ubiquitin-protein ligase Siah1 isoform X1 n=1 Tax=Melanotaenia boesemani TaxID=1250792 RepID=UPI001C0468EA|nr:E3 ubiquitin-protein ligase Siah1 isoform X1 [Melanotaenia boesemani]